MNSIKYLEYFYYVAREGSVSRGAKAMGITQPTVTKMIKDLEEIKGVELFNRHSKGVSLTENGEFLFKQCEELYKLASSIFPDIKLYNERKIIKIGVEDFISSEFLVDIVRELSEEFPNYELQLISGVTDDLYIKLQSNEIQFVISFYRPRIKGLFFKKLREYKQVIVAKSKLSKTKEYTFIGQRQINTKQNNKLPTVGHLVSKGYKINNTISSNSLNFTKKYVMEYDSVTLLPYLSVKDELNKKELIRIDKAYEFHSTLKLSYTNESPNNVLLFLEKHLT